MTSFSHSFARLLTLAGTCACQRLTREKDELCNTIWLINWAFLLCFLDCWRSSTTFSLCSRQLHIGVYKYSLPMPGELKDRGISINLLFFSILILLSHEDLVTLIESTIHCVSRVRLISTQFPYRLACCCCWAFFCGVCWNFWLGHGESRRAHTGSAHIIDCSLIAQHYMRWWCTFFVSSHR